MSFSFEKFVVREKTRKKEGEGRALSVGDPLGKEDQ
jgi:hypothetical protein